MISIEEYRVTNTKSFTNPDFPLNQELIATYTSKIGEILRVEDLFKCSIEYRVLIAKDIEDDICSAMTLNINIKGSVEGEISKDEIVNQMDYIIKDIIDYHCYMINIEPSLIVDIFRINNKNAS